MSAGKFGWNGIGVHGGQESVGSDLWKDRAFTEKDAGVVSAFSPSPPPQRGGNWRRLRMRDVHLRGKVFRVLAPGRDHAGCMCKIGVSAEMCFACLEAETRAVLHCVMGFFFDRGIHLHQLILIINENLWNARWMLSPWLGTGVWRWALEKFLPRAQLTAAVVPGAARGAQCQLRFLQEL